MQTLQRIAIYLLVLAQLATLPACSRDSTYHGPAQPGGLFGALAQSFNLGEKAYALVRSRLLAGTDGAAKAAALEARRDEFVAAVNSIITVEAVQAIGPTARAIFALVDDGTLPLAAENVAQVLDALLAEPDQRTLKAIVALSDTRAVVQVDDVLDYMARSANLPEFEGMIAAVAELVRQNDGVDDQGQPNGEPRLVEALQSTVAAGLRDFAAGTPTTAPGMLDGAVQELLAVAPARTRVGDPVWLVRADKHGNPSAAKDAQGKPLSPFVDANADGAADVNASGEAVDAQGAVIDLPIFGIAGAPGRDGWGRAVDAQGRLLYAYYDAKETLLAHALVLVGEAFRRRIDEQIYDTAEIALGARVPSDNGTPADPADDFQGFARPNPVADAAWGALEITKVDTAPRFARAIAELVKTDPTLAEKLLVTIGKIVERLRPILLAPATVPAAQSRATVDRLLVLADQVFRTQGGTTSVGRTLFDVMHGLGRTARALPRQLALMARYKKLALDPQGNPLPAPQSVLVDRSQPATTAGSPQGENRSALHQLLDLLARADQCQTFVWAGRPLSETVIELMAGRSAGTATTLISFLRSTTVRGLVSLYCPQIRDDLDGLDALASSGALAGFLPIAKAFVDRGETRLLVDILKTVDADYTAAIRPYEEPLADALESGAVDAIFDALDLLVAGKNGQPVRDPATGQRAVDVVADALAKLVERPSSGVRNRRGVAAPTLLHLVLEPLRQIDDRFTAASGGQALATALVYSLTDLVAERRWNDNGTADPADDFEELLNPSVAPIAGRAIDLLARNLPSSASERAAMVGRAQGSLVGLLEGAHFATFVDTARVLRTSPATGPIRNSLIQLLTPDPIARFDLYGAMLKLVGTTLEAKIQTAPLRDLARFGADVVDPRSRRIVALVDAFSKLLVADRGRTVMTLVRNVLNDAPPQVGLPSGTSPAEVLVSVMEDIRRASTPGTPSSADQVADLRGLVEEAVRLIRDQQSGLAWLFGVIAGRSNP